MCGLAASGGYSWAYGRVLEASGGQAGGDLVGGPGGAPLPTHPVAQGDAGRPAVLWGGTPPAGKGYILGRVYGGVPERADEKEKKEHERERINDMAMPRCA